MFIRKRSKLERLGTKAVLSLREKIEDLDAKRVAAFAGVVVAVAAVGLRRVFMR